MSKKSLTEAANWFMFEDEKQIISEMETVEVKGRKYKVKKFKSDVEANKFLEKNKEWGVIKAGKVGEPVYVAKKKDKGEKIVKESFENKNTILTEAANRFMFEDEIELEEVEDEKYEEETPSKKVIRTSYETWDEESTEIGETDDKGWYDEEGEEFEDVEGAIEWLEEKGSGYEIQPSSSQFTPGTYYTIYDAKEDYESGTTTNYSFHLDGFDEDEQEVIYNAVVGM